MVPAPLKLGAGAVVTGRVLRDGKPVAGVSMGLLQMTRGGDDYLGELTVMTDNQGRFRFDHAFTDQEFSAHTVTGSLANHGAITPRMFRTGADGSAIDLGEFEVKRGRRLAGRVVFADGKAIPSGPRSWLHANTHRACSRSRSTPRAGSKSSACPRARSISGSGSLISRHGRPRLSPLSPE